MHEWEAADLARRCLARAAGCARFHSPREAHNGQNCEGYGCRHEAYMPDDGEPFGEFQGMRFQYAMCPARV
jgi:hypothetical protein